jgi:hypothetical protein
VWQVLKTHPLVNDVVADGESLHVVVKEGREALPKLLPALDAVKAGVRSITVSRPSLDDVFLKHTGKAFTAEDSAGGNAWWSKWQPGGSSNSWGKQWSSSGSEGSEHVESDTQHESPPPPASASTPEPSKGHQNGGASEKGDQGDWKKWAKSESGTGGWQGEWKDKGSPP